MFCEAYVTLSAEKKIWQNFDVIIYSDFYVNLGETQYWIKKNM